MPDASLAQALRQEHELALVRQAELRRDWPQEPQRREQAEIHVRLALWEQGIGRISQAAQHRVYTVLSFVMPDAAALPDEQTPLAELVRETDVEAVYYEQLERQSCPECGDGFCPADEIRPVSQRPCKTIYRVARDGVVGVVESPQEIDSARPLA